MILNGNQRGGGRQMALHLLNGEKNEHVSVHEVSGFISEDVHEALNEAYALSKGTKCRQYMYSASFNPPKNANVSIETFENAINRAEKKLGLETQPRVIVFHEKEGRRHAHCVWSRIDIDEMKAVNVSHPKLKLKSLSKELYLENNWQLPKGFIDPNQKDPLNFTRAEWSQAQRTGQNPKTIKETLQECWMISDSRSAFEHALQERGYYLAKGDKKNIHMAVDIYGEVYSLTRKIGIKKAVLEKRIGEANKLPSIENTKEVISKRLSKQFHNYHDELLAQHQKQLQPLENFKHALTEKHRKARFEQKNQHDKRWQDEENKRAVRVRKGFKGLWDKLTGTYQRTRLKNEKDTAKNFLRDRKEKEKLIAVQLTERKKLQTQFQEKRQHHIHERAELIKGMDKRYKKIEHQSEIRKLFEQEKDSIRHSISNEHHFEPEL